MPSAQKDARAGLIISGGVLSKAGVVSVNPPSILTNASGTVAVTIAGVTVGDLVWLIPPDTLEDGLVLEGAAVTADNTLTIAVRNASTGTIDGAARNWGFLVIRR